MSTTLRVRGVEQTKRNSRGRCRWSGPSLAPYGNFRAVFFPHEAAALPAEHTDYIGQVRQVVNRYRELSTVAFRAIC